MGKPTLDPIAIPSTSAREAGERKGQEGRCVRTSVGWRARAHRPIPLPEDRYRERRSAPIRSKMVSFRGGRPRGARTDAGLMTARIFGRPFEIGGVDAVASLDSAGVVHDGLSRRRARTKRLDEGPQHAVTFNRGFWLGETPVTQALWTAVLGPQTAIRVDSSTRFSDRSSK